MGRLIAASVVVGALGAATAIAVRVVLSHGIRRIHGTEDVVDDLSAAPIWLRIVAPTAGGFAAGLIVHLLIRRGPPAVADVMEAVALGRGRPRLGPAAAQAAGTVVAVVGGASLGREGPLIQLGAGVGPVVASRFTLSERDRRALVAAGTAAGFAAAYNTPIAAVLFVLEVIVGVVTLDVVVPVAVATAVGTLLTRAAVGGGPIYGLRAFDLASPVELIAFAMEPDPLVVPADEPLDSALARLAEGQGRHLYVTDDGPLRAISLTIAKQLWARCMRGEALPSGATAGDVAVVVTVVRPDDTLLEIGEKLWNVDWGELPVVDPAAPGVPLGTITRHSLLGAFDRELLQRDVLTTRPMTGRTP